MIRVYTESFDTQERPVDIPKAAVEQCHGTGQMSSYFRDLAASLERDGYDGVVSVESVHRPDGGTFEDGFRTSFPGFRERFG